MGGVTFGPFFIEKVIASRNHNDLCRASLFLPDGKRYRVALRRTRIYHDGANERFLFGAKHYAVLHHENVAEVRDLGILEGRSYVATDLIDGHNLLTVLARCGRKHIGFPTDVALFIVRNILLALVEAHDPSQRGVTVLHGDICHSNVLLAFDGTVHLTDFAMRGASTRKRTSQGIHIGGGKGYSCYFAPEQARGEAIDARADLYQVGIILYELVTGHVLQTARTEQAIIDRLADGNVEIPLNTYRPDIHRLLDWIIKKSLSPDPSDRFSNANEFLGVLDELLRRVKVELWKGSVCSLLAKLFEVRAEGEPQVES